ncbi:hypothetical protein K461DRAFT_232993 [Myriangium duriaei CBS 260.36]|uniref:D-isomer specific 2-hydroxyacid dehydrogenase NAD-binding domain-containing protein n=1 Tax=Myriangium duriaei CBS 260.36 TaxID=1168546 RepID=A0A9P4ITY3_9PEZI|nr:hypothetical protein K461DRAFT_232993 [Myriangium duriaei CBS 260.36]
MSNNDPPQRSTENTTHSLAILDDYAQIAEKHFSSIPNLRITSFPSTLAPSDHSSLISRLQPYTIISTMRERTPLPAPVLSSLPNLRLLLTTSTRNASIHLPTCQSRSIPVTGTRGFSIAFDAHDRPVPTSSPDAVRRIDPLPSGSTTQHTLSLLLALTSRVTIDDHALKSDPDAWQSGLTMPLAGKTLGVVGLGKLGGAMARACALALGMKVVAWSASLDARKVREMEKSLGLEEGSIRAVSKEELFSTADVVSVHYVLSDRSRGVVGREDIGRMKKGAVLVNSARGPLVDEDALYEALVEGRIRGAALDVYWSQEPLEEGSRWRTTKWGMHGKVRVVLSPHMGYVNEDTMETWYAEQADNVRRFIEGRELGFQLT